MAVCQSYIWHFAISTIVDKSGLSQKVKKYIYKKSNSSGSNTKGSSSTKESFWLQQGESYATPSFNGVKLTCPCTRENVEIQKCPLFIPLHLLTVLFFKCRILN